MSRKYEDLTGKKYGRLTVIEPKGRNSNNIMVWKCLCECGNLHEATTSNLNSGSTSSCGCYKSEYVAKKNYKHGDSNTRLHSIWRGIKDRCYNKNDKAFPDYGDRGIKMCDDWLDYNSFKDWALLNGYDEHLTIDRINVNKGYEPENCRWATDGVQANNKRNNIFIEYDGTSLTASQWAKVSGVPSGTIRWRIKKGWSAGDAIFKKTGKNEDIQ